ncbi:unnamed protein product (macronuclear) [Paramecium tetraurelia]|uniref:Protein kinase domain-containing protein n=1 Tax=Paramecium tetraurelia TaxID=5888 RepID=A0DNS8_PARTE|nr:uncharacterized protein GSPATT00018891001 [Paramecium tetraurelia]CAK84695.1 unnamed protein product [Paramecium tetraurelia]|eukprot:XP_001452092.1 hypothetical protein (macronuclear) [Paramecium tetraurelia strain d4-2]
MENKYKKQVIHSFSDQNKKKGGKKNDQYCFGQLKQINQFILRIRLIKSKFELYKINRKYFTQNIFWQSRIEIFCIQFDFQDQLIAAGIRIFIFRLLRWDSEIIQYNHKEINVQFIRIIRRINLNNQYQMEERLGKQSQSVVINVNSDGSIMFWHAQKGKQLHRLVQKNNSILCMDLRLDGEVFATSGKDCKIRIYEGEKRNQFIHLLQPISKNNQIGHLNQVFALKFLEEFPTILLSCGWDGNLVIWDLRDKRIVGSIQGPHVQVNMALTEQIINYNSGILVKDHQQQISNGIMQILKTLTHTLVNLVRQTEIPYWQVVVGGKKQSCLTQMIIMKFEDGFESNKKGYIVLIMETNQTNLHLEVAKEQSNLLIEYIQMIMDPQNLIDNLNEVLLGDYFTYIDTLGKGSFGIVVAAYSSSLDKVVAIKVYPKLIQITQYFEQENESSLLQECPHPNIVKLYKVLIAHNRVYLIMEKLVGTTLDVLMKSQVLPETLTRNIMLQILNALVFLHRKGIIHRDLKPENIFICDNNYVKLIDLGLGYQMLSRGFIGQQVGTPYYIAPEIINQQEQSQLVDIFSLGIIFHQMINNCQHPLWQQGYTKKDYYKVISSEFLIQYPPQMSKMAKDFVENTVTFQSINRMTAQQCLEHPWVLGEQIKSHPITNREIKLRYQFTKNFNIIVKALWILKIFKEQCSEEIFYMKTQASDEINEVEDELQDPLSSRVQTEKLITTGNGRQYRLHRNTTKVERKPSIKLIKTSSHQDLTQLKYKFQTSKKSFIRQWTPQAQIE